MLMMALMVACGTGATDPADDQGLGDIEALQEQIQRDQLLDLWWD